MIELNDEESFALWQFLEHSETPKWWEQEQAIHSIHLKLKNWLLNDSPIGENNQGA